VALGTYLLHLLKGWVGYTTTYQNCGLYYKPMMVLNDDSRIINKLEASLTDDARVVIYDRHMFIVQATGSDFVVRISQWLYFTGGGGSLPLFRIFH
jgi:hypothetical protein